jgi:hypothetical protein
VSDEAERVKVVRDMLEAWGAAGRGLAGQAAMADVLDRYLAALAPDSLAADAATGNDEPACAVCAGHRWVPKPMDAFNPSGRAPCPVCATTRSLSEAKVQESAFGFTGQPSGEPLKFAGITIDDSGNLPPPVPTCAACPKWCNQGYSWKPPGVQGYASRNRCYNTLACMEARRCLNPAALP